VDEGLARPQQLRRLVGTALWREELRKPCGRSPHGPSQWPEPFVVQAQASQAPRFKAVRDSQRDSLSPSCHRCKRSKVYAAVNFRCCLPPRWGRKEHTWGACKAHAKLCHHCDGRRQPRPESRPGPTHGVRHWGRAGWWQSWQLEWLKGMGVASRQCPLGWQRPLQQPEPPAGKWGGPRALGKHCDRKQDTECGCGNEARQWAHPLARSRQGVHRCGTSSLRLCPSWVRARTYWNRSKHPLSLRLSRRKPFPPSRCARENPGVWASPMRIPR